MENPGAFVQTLQNQALESWNAAPADVRDQIPNLPTIITSAGITAYTIIETKPIVRIAEGLNSSVTLSPEKANCYIAFCEKTNATISENKVTILNCLTSNKVPPKEICDKICSTAAWTANTILITGLLSNGLQLCFNYIAIYNICKAINESGIAIKYSKDRIEKILKQKDKIPQMIDGLSKILEELKMLKEDADQKNINRLQNEANFCKDEINEELEEILKDIGKLELYVNGRKIQLESSRKAAISGAISGVASSASGFANVLLLKSVGNGTLSGLTLALSLLNLACSAKLLLDSESAAQVLVYVQEQLNAIEQLKESVEEQQKEVKKLAKRIFHAIRQLTV